MLLFLLALYATILKGQAKLSETLADQDDATIVNVDTGNIPYQEDT
ncbi:MAG: hypothetical protein WCG98_05870 [bacterium]